jgi:hypothetical protein
MQKDLTSIVEQLSDVIPGTDVQEYSRKSWTATKSDSGERVWAHEVTWRYVDGTELKLSGEQFTGMAFPARPGFEFILIEFKLGSEDPNVRREPIVGWVAGSARFELDVAVPLAQHCITAEEPGQYLGIGQPDGRVAWNGRWFVDVDAFAGAARSHWLAELEKEKERLLLSYG